MTEKEFETFRPLKNPHGDHGWDATLWETYGVELNFVRNQQPNRVWTLMNDDEGNLVIVTGFHFVNRVGYFVTEIPWAEDSVVDLD